MYLRCQATDTLGNGKMWLFRMPALSGCCVSVLAVSAVTDGGLYREDADGRRRVAGRPTWLLV